MLNLSLLLETQLVGTRCGICAFYQKHYTFFDSEGGSGLVFMCVWVDELACKFLMLSPHKSQWP